MNNQSENMSKKLKHIFGDITGLDDRSLDSLTAALEKANLPGFDYLEFKQSLDALSGMGMDEATAYKSAFATASTMGLTKDKLLSTAKHYKEVLKKEMEQFDQACKNQIEHKVNSKKAEVEKLKNQIESYKAKIAKLQEQIKKHQNTVQTADSNIQASLDKIKSTKSAFDHTFQSVMNQIEKDIENIDSNL